MSGSKNAAFAVEPEVMDALLEKMKAYTDSTGKSGSDFVNDLLKKALEAEIIKVSPDANAV